MKLKICGMRDERNIGQVAELGVDYMGFIFYAKSPRYVGEDFQIPSLSSYVKRIGVFVNETTDIMRRKADELSLDYLQLHGHESVEQCEELKRNKIKLIKVFSIGNDFDFRQTKDYKGVVDFFLFDTKGKYHGGNAMPFDWRVLDAYDQEVPFFLSGGIGPENIMEVNNLKGKNIHAVDVNSGVEAAPAVKDIVKIKLLKQRLTF
jgi:phosphoribosylanthranilate isomerase